MRVLLQRVTQGSVAVDGNSIATIERGLVLLVGIGAEDEQEQGDYLAEKIANLRIFEDAQGKMNLSVLDIGGSALVVSQFTLYANTQKGRRPSFVEAAKPELAEPLVQHFAGQLQALGVPVKQGHFGAHMQVRIENDGPVTIWLERD